MPPMHQSVLTAMHVAAYSTAPRPAAADGRSTPVDRPTTAAAKQPAAAAPTVVVNPIVFPTPLFRDAIMAPSSNIPPRQYGTPFQPILHSREIQCQPIPTRCETRAEEEEEGDWQQHGGVDFAAEVARCETPAPFVRSDAIQRRHRAAMYDTTTPAAEEPPEGSSVVPLHPSVKAALQVVARHHGHFIMHKQALPSPAPHRSVPAAAGQKTDGRGVIKKQRKPREHSCNVWDFSLEAGTTVSVRYVLQKLSRICSRFIFVVEQRKVPVGQHDDEGVEESRSFFRGRVFLRVSV